MKNDNGSSAECQPNIVRDWDSEDSYKQIQLERGTGQRYGQFGLSDKGSDLRKTIDTSVHWHGEPTVSQLIRARGSSGVIGSIVRLFKGLLGREA